MTISVFLRDISIFVCFMISSVVSAQERITLAENAPLDNSIMLLKTLRNYYPADSLIKWAQQDGRSLILCRVDSSGMILEFEKYRIFKKSSSFLSENGDNIRNILINNRVKFVFPCSFTGYSTKCREIFLQKESIYEIYKKKGYIDLQIPIFYVMFPTIFHSINEYGERNNIELTAEETLDILFERYISKHY